MSTIPVFRALDPAECEALLVSQHVGRLAFTFRDRVDIEPIHYVYRHGCIIGRTQLGTKVNVLAHHPWVAFEVDHVEGLFTWRSVVVHGRMEFPDPDGAPTDRERFARGVEAFRTLVPGAFTKQDPTPDRDLVFMLPVADMRGRGARQDPG
ncbi:MAG: pyridoxamine 5'-phosphate oxidase family protein [Gemmatimonas sp.]|jgi:nitroimidazol reductase NimA-like FMN-containing flavoprotein (pyridoxamine 5'-phosphate oxidase superfamily)|uniref:pyridoxamine 5'-phosphate oxidase family protein n=1 Tax=Gemmatimonas sp. TaxID=1962908 RepID=UPI00391EF58E|nr:pyridoxamine 5'-phosphate oxidase family protein [Gemmatimonadota bacterium]